MTIINNFTLPSAVNGLVFPSKSSGTFFITFTTSDLPETGQSWCPDVRAALPHLKAAFEAEHSPEMAFVAVGQRPEWRVPTNVFRTTWDVHNVPTLMRYERVDGEVKETGRLVEGEILEQGRLQNLIGK